MDHAPAGEAIEIYQSRMDEFSGFRLVLKTQLFCPHLLLTSYTEKAFEENIQTDEVLRKVYSENDYVLKNLLALQILS